MNHLVLRELGGSKGDFGYQQGHLVTLAVRNCKFESTHVVRALRFPTYGQLPVDKQHAGQISSCRTKASGGSE